MGTAPSPSLSLSVQVPSRSCTGSLSLRAVFGLSEVRLFGITQRWGPRFVIEKGRSPGTRPGSDSQNSKRVFFFRLLATCRLIAASGCQHQPIFPLAGFGACLLVYGPESWSLSPWAFLARDAGPGDCRRVSRAGICGGLQACKTSDDSPC